MRVLTLGFVTSVAMAAIAASEPVRAADLAARPYTKAPAVVVDPAYNWSGWYVGVNGGWAWGNTTGDRVATSADLLPAVAIGTVPNLNAKHEGGFGGAQAGYNWQTGNWVFGIETDIQGSDIGRTTTTVVPFPVAPGLSTSTGRDHMDWFGTFRGRIGIAANNVLFYGTAGAAYGGVHITANDIGSVPGSGTFTSSTSDTLFGWAAGAGIEWGVTPNWTVKGEYLHIDLGSTNVNARDLVLTPASFITYRFRHQVDLARVGINYKFGGPVVARY